ncbi:LemA family protein [Agrilactobacillus yilanensis]|uniref:LemA family protein n=1 Tax=Agrilactobacillus yilanensis TaxID=2485997 RepID=A0ABW4J4M2_9LACO|nr:LemA family protein [Agrilactobacillus yilanensis]
MTNNQSQKHTARNILIGVAIIVVGLIMIGVNTYNGLAKQNQKVESAWSQVQNVMQRRYDLVPNLVNSVKGSMKQEQKVFGDIAAARKSYNSASSTKEKISANAKLDQSVGTLVNVIQENYPDLKSNENVQTLMTQLEGTENRISVERKRYNDAVQTYNQSMVTFPKNIFANMMGLGQKPYFKASTNAQNAPTVNFDDTTDGK